MVSEKGGDCHNLRTLVRFKEFCFSSKSPVSTFILQSTIENVKLDPCYDQDKLRIKSQTDSPFPQEEWLRLCRIIPHRQTHCFCQVTQVWLSHCEPVSMQSRDMENRQSLECAYSRAADFEKKTIKPKMILSIVE